MGEDDAAAAAAADWLGLTDCRKNDIGDCFTGVFAALVLREALRREGEPSGRNSLMVYHR